METFEIWKHLNHISVEVHATLQHILWSIAAIRAVKDIMFKISG